MYCSRQLANELVRYQSLFLEINETVVVDAKAITEADARSDFNEVLTLALQLHAKLDDLIQKSASSNL